MPVAKRDVVGDEKLELLALVDAGEVLPPFVHQLHPDGPAAAPAAHAVSTESLLIVLLVDVHPKSSEVNPLDESGGDNSGAVLESCLPELVPT